jgi:hypothetical protein
MLNNQTAALICTESICVVCRLRGKLPQEEQGVVRGLSCGAGYLISLDA